MKIEGDTDSKAVRLRKYKRAATEKNVLKIIRGAIVNAERPKGPEELVGFLSTVFCLYG